VGGRRPAKRDKIKTTFYLLTRLAFGIKSECQITMQYACRQNAQRSININPSRKFQNEVSKLLRKVRKTVIITHGFRSNSNKNWVKRMANAFLEKVIPIKLNLNLI
jgi:hypothetical protein